jgi:trimeric autotransporter adhesin
MKRSLALSALVAGLILLPGCKGSTTPATVMTIFLSSTAGSMLYIGETAVINATARLTDNSGIEITTNGTWASDDTSIATVNNTGLVTAVGSGQVTITVSYGGKSATRSFRCLPNYGGSWTGTYTVTTCGATGDFELYSFCGTVPAGTVLNTDLILTQTGDQISGQIYLGTLTASATGPVAMDGHLVLKAKVIEGDFTIDTVYTMQSATPGALTGDMTQLWLGLGATWMGQGQLACALNTFTRTSTMSREPGVAGLQSLPPNPTLQDVLNALRRR